MLDLLMPLLAVALTIYVKCVTRGDAQFYFRKEDFAVGLEISVVAVLMLVAGPAGRATTAPWLVLAMMLGVWATSAFIRKYGWDGEGRLHLVRGIVIPDVVGLAMLLGVVLWPRG